MRGYMYILRCADLSHYVGSTSTLEVRLAGHRSGEGSAYTASRLPVAVVYTQEFATVYETFLAERQVKGWSRAKKEALIRGDFAALPELSPSRSRPRAEPHRKPRPEQTEERHKPS